VRFATEPPPKEGGEKKNIKPTDGREKTQENYQSSGTTEARVSEKEEVKRKRGGLPDIAVSTGKAQV